MDPSRVHRASRCDQAVPTVLLLGTEGTYLRIGREASYPLIDGYADLVVGFAVSRESSGVES